MLWCCYWEEWYLHLSEDKSQAERLLDGLDSDLPHELEDSKLTPRFWSNCRTGVLPAFYQTILLLGGKILSLVNAASFKKLFLLSFFLLAHQCIPQQYQDIVFSSHCCYFSGTTNLPACCFFFLPTAAPMIWISSSSEAPARRWSLKDTSEFPKRHTCSQPKETKEEKRERIK